MTSAKHTMFSPTKVSFVTVQNSVIELRRYFPCNKFKIGRVSNKRWSADHGLLATDTLPSPVDTLALITRRIRILKGGRAAATVNVSEFRRDTLCLCSQWRVAKCGDTLCLCSQWRVAKCGCRLFEARQKVTPAPHELHRNKNVS
jgi:hypothetical protein